MGEKDINQIIRIYSDRLSKHGVSPKALGWDKKRTNLRFEILSSQWNLSDLSILDFGCGFGDFYNFLVQKNITGFNYLGIDINPRFLEIAKSLYPNASFRVFNILKEPLECKYDYIFASGVFNDKLNDNLVFIESVLQKFDEYSEKGFAANFLSDRVQYRHRHTFHADPSYILNLCYKYSNNIILRNDYMPFEFTIFVNKDSKYDSELVVYNEFIKYM
jgi:SAM-dependent methyltransferase